MKDIRKVLLVFPITVLALMLVYMPVTATEEQNIQENAENQEAQQEQEPQENNEDQEKPAEGEAQDDGEEAEQPEQEAPAPTPRRTTRKKTTTQEQTQETQENNETEENSTSTQEGKYTLILLSNANMRAEASTESASKVVVPFGIKITSDEKVTNEAGEAWYHVSYGGTKGYIREDVVKVQEETVQEEENEPEETQEGEEENTEEATSMASYQDVLSKTYTPSKSSTSTTATSTESSTTQTFKEESYGNAEAVVNRRQIDVVLLLFLGIATLGFILAAITGSRLANEYKKRKAYIIKHSEYRELFIDMNSEKQID